MKKSIIAILLTLLFVMLAIPAFATNSSDIRIIDSDIQLHVIQRGVQEALITISDNGTIWIDLALSREDIVKVMFEAGWPDNYELIFGKEK